MLHVSTTTISNGATGAAIAEARTVVPKTVDRLMTHFGVSAIALGQELGVSRQAVYSRLRGTAGFKSEEMVGLSVLFGVPTQVLSLSPDDALRWVLDHPERRPPWFKNGRFVIRGQVAAA